jgi:hypothetical protein
MSTAITPITTKISMSENAMRLWRSGLHIQSPNKPNWRSILSSFLDSGANPSVPKVWTSLRELREARRSSSASQRSVETKHLMRCVCRGLLPFCGPVGVRVGLTDTIVSRALW